MAKKDEAMEMDDEDLIFAQIYAAAVGGVTAANGDGNMTPAKIASRAMDIADAAMSKFVKELAKAAEEEDEDEDDDEDDE